MLDREGAHGPADIALIGTEHDLTGRVEELAAVGVDELAVGVHGRNDEERARTRSFLQTLG
jgi:5,10-methylenetetrahydromethanopterin reductase